MFGHGVRNNGPHRRGAGLPRRSSGSRPLAIRGWPVPHRGARLARCRGRQGGKPKGRRTRVADAVHAGFSGARPLDEAMAEYQRVRDEHFAPLYDLTCGMAALEPPQPEMLALYQALRHNSVERDRYFGTLGGTVPIPEFYAWDNVRRIISAASV